MPETGTIERAFVLAATGKFQTVEQIRRQLKKEGHTSVAHHLSGAGTKRQLLAIMKTVAH